MEPPHTQTYSYVPGPIITSASISFPYSFDYEEPRKSNQWDDLSVGTTYVMKKGEDGTSEYIGPLDMEIHKVQVLVDAARSLTSVIAKYYVSLDEATDEIKALKKALAYW